jgi:hypothetical protein
MELQAADRDEAAFLMGTAGGDVPVKLASLDVGGAVFLLLLSGRSGTSTVSMVYSTVVGCAYSKQVVSAGSNDASLRLVAGEQRLGCHAWWAWRASSW